MLMTRVKEVVGWKYTPRCKIRRRRIVRRYTPEVQPVWGWFKSDFSPTTTAASSVDGPRLEEWAPTSMQGHGMMSIFSYVLGKLRQVHAESKVALAINLQESATVYGASNVGGNIWIDYFQQPHEVTHAGYTLVPQSTVTTKGKNIGSAGVYDHNPISNNAGLVYDTRELVSRYLRLQPDFQCHLQNLAQKIFKPGVKYLAVHVRLTVKWCEAKLNFELTLEDMVAAVVQAAKDFGDCWGIFLCSDDKDVKRYLGQAMLEHGFEVVGMTNSGLGLHFDRDLNKHTKTLDIWTETVLMARFCHGLVSTFSNVSSAVVYLSPYQYPHRDFWGRDLLPMTLGSRPDNVSRRKKQKANHPTVDADATPEEQQPILHLLGGLWRIVCLECSGTCGLLRDDGHTDRHRLTLITEAMLHQAVPDRHMAYLWGKLETFPSITAVVLAPNIKLRRQALKLALALSICRERQVPASLEDQPEFQRYLAMLR